MPTVLSRLRGLLAPTTGDQPLRLADGGGGGAGYLTTKGDLLGFGSGVARIPVGTDGEVLTADSTQVLGVKWASGGGGGGSGGNVTPDTHPSSATAWDDEFEASSLSSQWAWLNQDTATATFAHGTLHLQSKITSANEIHAITQAVPSGTAWEFRAKISQIFHGSYNNGGLLLEESSTGKIVRYILFDNAGSPNFDITQYSNPTTQVGSLGSAAITLPVYLGVLDWVYFSLALVSGNYVFGLSLTGEEGTFQTIHSGAITEYFTTAATTIGICASGQNASYPADIYADWFRRIS